MTVMVFDNAIYGLTKKQTSPTSPIGLRTNTHPMGNPLPPQNPLTVTLGIANVSFVAQTIDWNPLHLHATLWAAFKHKGLAFVRIFQRCPAMNEHGFDELQRDPAKMLLLTHECGIPIEATIAERFPNRREHNPADLGAAWAIAQGQQGIPVGLLFQDSNRPCYDELSSAGLGMASEQKLQALERALDRFAV